MKKVTDKKIAEEIINKLNDNENASAKFVTKERFDRFVHEWIIDAWEDLTEKAGTAKEVSVKARTVRVISDKRIEKIIELLKPAFGKK